MKTDRTKLAAHVLTDMMRWAWNEIKAGRSGSRNLYDKKAKDVMEACIQLLEKKAAEYDYDDQ